MNKMLKHSLSIGFIVAAPLAAADTALHCTTIQDNATRLACYDNIYSAQLPPQFPLPQAQTETAKTPVDLEQSVRKSIEKKRSGHRIRQPYPSEYFRRRIKRNYRQLHTFKPDVRFG